MSSTSQQCSEETLRQRLARLLHRRSLLFKPHNTPSLAISLNTSICKSTPRFFPVAVSFDQFFFPRTSCLGIFMLPLERKNQVDLVIQKIGSVGDDIRNHGAGNKDKIDLGNVSSPTASFQFQVYMPQSQSRQQTSPLSTLSYLQASLSNSPQSCPQNIDTESQRAGAKSRRA
jgi:hypothetical protein